MFLSKHPYKPQQGSDPSRSTMPMIKHPLWQTSLPNLKQLVNP